MHISIHMAQKLQLQALIKSKLTCPEYNKKKYICTYPIGLNRKTQPAMLDQTLENKILRQQLDQLRKDFATKYEERNHMLLYEEPLLNSVYLTTVGTMQFRVFTLRGDLAILEEKIRLGQIDFNRNVQPDWSQIEATVKEQFQDYQHKVNKEANRMAAAKQVLKSDFLSSEEAAQLKETYKILVKRLHPDLNPNQAEADKELFLSVQAAYNHSNLTALTEALLYINGRTEQAPVVESSDLQQQVDHLSAMNADLQKKIDTLNDSFPFNFRELLDDERWIEKQKEQYQLQITSLETELTQKNEYLLLLMSWKPELLH